MIRMFIAPLAIVCLAASLPAHADKMEQARRMCNGETPEKVIRGCSFLLDRINAGKHAKIAAKVHYSRGKAYAANKQRDHAIADFGMTIRLDPDHLGAYLKRGKARWDNNLQDLALADFNTAARIAPQNYFPFFFRGLLHQELKQYGKAIADYGRALERGPDAESTAGIKRYKKQVEKLLAAQ